MYRRTVLDSFQFNPSISASADFDLNIRIARDFPIYCHDKAVLEYRKHDSNMSANSSVMLKHAVTARRLQWKYVKGRKQYEDAYRIGIRVVREDYGEQLVSQVRGCIREHQWVAAIRGMVVLLRCYPRGFATHFARGVYSFLFRVKS